MKRFKKMVVFIDGDNVSHHFIPHIMNKLNQQGHVILNRVYGDFAKDNLKPWIDVANTHHITLKQVKREPKGKNTTDIGLIIDAVDIIHTTPIDRFCLISGDGDFLQLIQYVKAKGINTLGISGSNRNNCLKDACHDFWNIQDELFSLSKNTEKQHQQKQIQAVIKKTEPRLYKYLIRHQTKSLHKGIQWNKTAKYFDN
jgi:hypothetical protein